MALHHPNEVRVGWGLELVFGHLFDAIDQASVGLSLRIGTDIGLHDPGRKSFNPRWVVQ